jgi:hypothetical protein
MMSRVGQNHIYTVFIRYFWQGNHQIYGHIRCIYTVLANPNDEGWPVPYLYTVYDRIFGDFPCQKYRKYTVHVWFWPTLHMMQARILRERQ